jgi:PAP2 superfamily
MGEDRVLPRMSRRPSRPQRWSAARRPRIWEELLFIAIAYEIYSLIRNEVPTRAANAFANAYGVLHLERALHINIEPTINADLASARWPSLAADYWYATMHFVVTIGVLVWLWRAHPLRYRAARSVLMITNLVALVGFWVFPLAPARMLPGFVDTVGRDHIWGKYASAGMASASNQFAAMPSMHVGWSLWCGMVILSLSRRRWVRIAGVLYPLITLIVIIGTANHYILDAVGGAAALACGWSVQRVRSGRPALAPPLLPGTISGNFLDAA